jgi:hypothetical protein
MQGRRDDVDYRLLLRALLLDALANCASPGLLLKAVLHFNEGNQHRCLYYILVTLSGERE